LPAAGVERLGGRGAGAGGVPARRGAVRSACRGRHRVVQAGRHRVVPALRGALQRRCVAEPAPDRGRPGPAQDRGPAGDTDREDRPGQPDPAPAHAVAAHAAAATRGGRHQAACGAGARAEPQAYSSSAQTGSGRTDVASVPGADGEFDFAGGHTPAHTPARPGRSRRLAGSCTGSDAGPDPPAGPGTLTRPGPGREAGAAGSGSGSAEGAGSGPCCKHGG